MRTADFNLTLEHVLDHIHQDGYGVIDNAIDENLIELLLTDCLGQQALFQLAGIGRQLDKQLNPTIRSDKTKWFEHDNLIQQHYLALMEQLRTAINRHFFLGLFDYECHYATYHHGDFYKKHFDAFKGRSNRVFTTVLYLNTPKQGGELVIYQPKSKDVLATIAPKAGTLVVFESERFAHEVLPAVDIRHSIAGWFRKNNSVNGVIDPTN